MVWRRNLNLVLIVEDVEWVIETPMHFLPVGYTNKLKDELD